VALAKALVLGVAAVSVEGAFEDGADEARFPVITIPTLNCAFACPAETVAGHSRHKVRMTSLDMLCLPVAAGSSPVGAKASRNGALRSAVEGNCRR
jgi:hypothetical protein